MSSRLHRLLQHPATWVVAGWFGFLSLFLALGLSYLNTIGFGTCYAGRCYMTPFHWALYVFGILGLGGGIVCHRVTRRRSLPPNL